MIGIAGVSIKRLEGAKPDISIDLNSTVIGASRDISITVDDKHTGLRRLRVDLTQNGNDRTLLLKDDFDAVDLLGRGGIRKHRFEVKITAKKLGLADGDAFLHVTASDQSWRNWGKGNIQELQKKITIDTTPPEISVLTRVHNIRQGGAGVVVYKVLEDYSQSGVYVGDNFFPGHSGYFEDVSIQTAFFALNYRQGPDTTLYLMATDTAGNRSKLGFPHHIRAKKFKQDVIELSDRFFKTIIPEFEAHISGAKEMSLLEKFLEINQKLRKQNYQQFVKITAKTNNEKFWSGGFLRFPNSATRAEFADHRTYKHQGETIDEQVHLGIDLASLKHADVPAANAGKIAFAGVIGIYGKTVIIDHGFGLFSTYSHLSQISVREGERVSKEAIIGKTGMTGLAVGDHLHFGMMIHNTFVTPIEWWDAEWIRKNITDKIKSIENELDSQKANS